MLPPLLPLLLLPLPLRFALELDLFGSVDAQASSWSAGSAGRLTLTLVKADEGAMWAALVKPPSADGHPGMPSDHSST